MSGSRQTAEQLIYQCPECGNKFPLWKTMNSRNRERSKPGHIKDLYCYRCEKVTKHEQLSSYIPMFKEVNMNLNLLQKNGVWYASSREVADAIEKRHDHLIRDIDGYIEIMTQTPNLGNGVTVQVSDFFIESQYISGIPARPYKSYLITRRGCDMVANKMTGEKGVLFTAAYVTKFEEMEKALQPQLPQTPIEALLLAVQNMAAQEKRINQLEDSQKTIKDTIVYRPDNWRDSINKMFDRVARANDNRYRDMRAESYRILEERAKCDLEKRLDNLKDRKREAGATATEVNRTNKIEVIEADQRLREIYTAIIKELVIRYVA